MATIDQFERTLLQFDLTFTSLSREKRLHKIEACEIYRRGTSIKHFDELANIVSWKNASVTTVHHAKISSDQASFIRDIISNTFPRDSIALDIGLSIFLLLIYRLSSTTLLSVSAKILPPQQSITLYFLGKNLFFRCRLSPLINYTPWSVFNIVCTLYQRIVLQEVGSIQLQVSTIRTRREKRRKRKKKTKEEPWTKRARRIALYQTTVICSPLQKTGLLREYPRVKYRWSFLPRERRTACIQRFSRKLWSAMHCTRLIR